MCSIIKLYCARYAQPHIVHRWYLSKNHVRYEKKVIWLRQWTGGFVAATCVCSVCICLISQHSVLWRPWANCILKSDWTKKRRKKKSSNDCMWRSQNTHDEMRTIDRWNKLLPFHVQRVATVGRYFWSFFGASREGLVAPEGCRCSKLVFLFCCLTVSDYGGKEQLCYAPLTASA